MKRYTLFAGLIVWALTLSAARAADGLIAYWPFDTDFANAQGNADYDGTPAGKAEISSEDVMVGTGALKIDDDTTTMSHVTGMDIWTISPSLTWN